MLSLSSKNYSLYSLVFVITDLHFPDIYVLPYRNQKMSSLFQYLFIVRGGLLFLLPAETL